MAKIQSLSTSDRDKFTLKDTNSVLHHIKWASALTRDQKSQQKVKHKNEAAQKKSIKDQSENDRKFTLKMLDLLKQTTENRVQLDKVIIKNVIDGVQKGNHLKARIRQMKRERRFPQPKTLKNRGYQYGFIPKEISKKLIVKD